MHEYDKSSKWLIQHHGDSILRLGGVDDVVSWRPLQAEVVQPRQLPDGLIEAVRRGSAEPDLFIVEVATYPEDRVLEQIVRDTSLVYLDRKILPEALVVVLHPKGKPRPLDKVDLRSPVGWTGWTIRWRCVELWNLDADDLLNMGDVGIVPWVPLARFDGPPEPIIRRCVDRIEAEASPDERENLLAVTQVLCRLRYNDPSLFGLLGGREAMIESPLIQEILGEFAQKQVMSVLEERFGETAQTLVETLSRVDDLADLNRLIKVAATCPDLETIRVWIHGIQAGTG